MDTPTNQVIHTRLTAEFPELAHLSYAGRCSALNETHTPHRREDLEDLLVDPQYFQAVFHTLPQVKMLYQGQAELGLANETIASEELRKSRKTIPADYSREQHRSARTIVSTQK